MALVQKHLLKRQRLGEMTSTLSLNYKNYLHFSLYIFKTSYFVGEAADACYTMQFIAPFRVQRYKFHISKMLEKNEERVKNSEYDYEERVKTQNTIMKIGLKT